MTRPFDELVHATLDGDATDAERAELSRQVAADPERARAFARAALLHDAIDRELCAAAEGRASARRVHWAAGARRFAAAAAVVLVAGTVAFLATRGQPALAAGAEAARLAARACDSHRTYVIHAEPQGSREGARAAERRPRALAPAQRVPDRPRPPRAKPSIDEALLHVGAPGSYVLVRTGADGTETVSGSDGRSAWSFAGDGPVRVSRDPSRFRGALPGEQHGLAFVDPVDGLKELLRSYDVAFDDSKADAAAGLRTIAATRRADASRGPKVVRITYDPADATIVRMQLDRLPQANGGPRSVTLELVEQSPLEPAFFTHEAHHGAGRTVIKED
jgi:hypothetical protein